MTAPEGAPAGDERAQRDQIAWRQILIGYGMVLMMLMIVVAARMDLFPDPSEGKGPMTLVVAAVMVVCALLARPMAALHRLALSSRPRLDDTLQWIAVGLLCLLSAATIVAGLLTLPLGDGA